MTLSATSPNINPISTTKARRVFRLALEYAVLAPSSHNTQPWLFRINDDTLELYADKTRVLKTVDPEGRELTMSCGAALYMLRLALRSFGYKEKTDLLPNTNSRDLLARVTLTGTQQPNQEDKRLFLEIPNRHTQHGRFTEKTLDSAVVNELELAAKLEGADLYITRNENTRRLIADLIADGDKRQWSDPDFRNEIATWTHPSHSKNQDGIPAYALGINDAASYLTPFIIRRFDMGRGQALKDHELAEHSSALALLHTPEDTPYFWLLAGQSLAHVLLKARFHTVQASFFNQPVEVNTLRSHLQQALGLSGVPQLLFRLGYGEEAKATPRRDIDDVVMDS
ncbi:MAG: Acg family FMN-binding oxidoreductase [Trueperaceae bacterium]